MAVIETTAATEAHPIFGSTPPEIIEAVQNGTYEAQPGLKDYQEYKASRGEQAQAPAKAVGPTAPVTAPAPTGVTSTSGTTTP